MKQVITVFAYTFKEGIRKKAFWVSTVIIMALILLLCFAPRIITAFETQEADKKSASAGEVQTEEGKDGICYFIDETGVFEKNLAAFQSVYPDLLFRISDVRDLEALKEDVAENEKHSILYIEDQEGLPFFRVINTNFMKGINTERIVETGTAVWQSEFLTGQGLSRELVAAAQTPLGYVEEAAGTMSLTGYVLGLVMTFVMFFAVYYYGGNVCGL